MILLRPSETKILLPIPASHWRTPSLAQPKDCFGNENRTRFVVTGRHQNGRSAWRGWFDDRDEADAFLKAAVYGSLRYERALWGLPTPEWHPDLGAGLYYDFITTVFITSGTTWPVPADCIGVSNQAGEFIDTIGGGASGAAQRDTTDDIGNATGGGGGAWSRITTLALTPGASITIQVGAGGTAVSRTTNGQTQGNDGTDTWFNGANLAASSVGAKAGNNGISNAGDAITAGGEGGLAASGVGTSKFDGGDGGDVTVANPVQVATGGGGAAGPSGAGDNGTNSAAAADGDTAGGAGDAGAGGTAGTAGGGAGGAGTEYDATHGSGGGGGGEQNTGTGTAGSGGLYGAGGGGAATAGTVTSGAGRQGLIVVAYAPFTPLSGIDFGVPVGRAMRRRTKVVSYH